MTTGTNADGELGYGAVAKALHWGMVVLIAAQFIVAWEMPEIEWGTEPERLINLHLSLGALLMLLVFFRIGWRLRHPAPPPLPGTPPWQRWAAGSTHLALYALLVVMSVTGWAASSARNWPISLFGAGTLPSLVPEGTKLGFKAGDLHADRLSWVLLGVIGIHVLAALYHHFVRRDLVLRRMLPWRSR